MTDSKKPELDMATVHEFLLTQNPEDIRRLVSALSDSFGVDLTTGSLTYYAPAVAAYGMVPMGEVIHNGPFGVRMVSYDHERRIDALLAIRKLSGIGLSDALKTLESMPIDFLEIWDREEMKETVETLNKAGIVVVTSDH